jgi:hypothetical protein
MDTYLSVVMNRYPTIFLASLVFVGFIRAEIQGQEVKITESKKYLWFGMGLGYVTYYDSQFKSGFSHGLHVSFQTDNTVLSMRCAIMGAGTDYLGDVGVLYGLSRRTSKGFSSIAGGISIVFGNLEDGAIDAIGFPVAIQYVPFVNMPPPFTGVGFYSFCDLNLRAPSCDIWLCFEIGKLR